MAGEAGDTGGGRGRRLGLGGDGLLGFGLGRAVRLRGMGLGDGVLPVVEAGDLRLRRLDGFGVVMVCVILWGEFGGYRSESMASFLAQICL